MGPRNNTTKKSKEIHWKPPHKPTSAAEIIEIEPPKAKTETMSSGRPDPKAPCQGAIHSAKPETSSIPDVGCNPTPVVDNLRSNVATPPGLPEGPEMHHEGKGESSNAAAPPEPTSDPTQTLSDKLQNLEQAFSMFREESVRKDQKWKGEVEGLKGEVTKLQQELEGVRQELNQMHQSLCKRQIVIAIYKLLGCKNFKSRNRLFNAFRKDRRVLRLKLEKEFFPEPISDILFNKLFRALDLGDDGIIKQGNVTAHEYTFEQGEKHTSGSDEFSFYLNFMQKHGYQ